MYKQVKKQLIHPWEKGMRFMNVIIFLLAVIGTLIYMGILLLNFEENMDTITKQAGVMGVFFVVIITLGRQYGKARANSVQLSEEQFPEIYQVVKDFSAKLELGYVPEVYLTQEGGVLNAFATSFFSRRYISLNCAIFEIAYLEHKDLDAVAFVIGHELAHLKRKHATTGMTLIEFIPGMIPIWGPAQSRVKEYTCDKHAAWLAPEGKESLILLATGKHMYKHVNIEDYLKTSQKNKGFFVWLYNLMASHPIGPKRMRALIKNEKGQVF